MLSFIFWHKPLACSNKILEEAPGTKFMLSRGTILLFFKSFHSMDRTAKNGTG
jgi:hypothetical protein